MNKNFYITLLCLLLISMLLILSINISPKSISVNADSVESSAVSSIVIETNSKRILFEKDCNKQLAMASTTKIMTALIALENCENLDKVIDVDNRAVGIEGTSIYLQKDEHLTMRELLYGLMLASGNDSACAIAYEIGNGDMNKFVNLMNDKVKELGLENTHFDNPHGLDSNNHYTSAYDLAIITAKAMENEDFREIVSTKNKQISGNKQVNARFLRNKHKLVGVLDGCDGVKTGFTDNARRCCVTSVKRENMSVICVVLNCNDMFEESTRLIEKAYETYTNECVLDPYYMLSAIKVENGTQDVAKIYTEKACYYPLKQEEKDLITFEVEVEESLTAPVEKGQNVGKLKVYLDKELIFSENIYTMDNIKEKGVTDKLKEIIDEWYFGANCQI